MSKKKAFVCTILYVIVLVGILTASFFVKKEAYGISLYQLIMTIIANIWLGCSITKFYEWLIK